MTTSARLPEDSTPRLLPRLCAVLLLLFVFMLGVKGLGSGFRLLGEDLIQSFFAATENPFVGLIFGLLATTLVQSSSVTTSMIVALVAAPESPLPLANAIPMVMGANIGTTVTATVVSLAHIGRRDEFERAFPVAICHDAFNYFSVIILLPLEMATGILRRSAVWMAGALGEMGGVEYESLLDTALDAGLAPFRALAGLSFGAQSAQGAFLAVVSGLLIFVALFLLVKVLRSVLHTRVEEVVNGTLGRSAVIAILVGIAVTVMVQSSSITTSVLVPLGAAGMLRLEQAFPVTIGANIGTTVTALLAAMAVSGPNAVVGLEIALVHLLFNLTGLAIIYPVQRIRRVPLDVSRAATRLALRSWKLTVLWVALLFYGLPSLCIAIAQWFR
ncbi:MAG: Na/Pi symporter [Acidobacteria bacterium]|nr:Na/Pi symporter [Acidobacteriota bacterium]